MTDPDLNLLSKSQAIAKGGEKGGEAGERAQIFSQTSVPWADQNALACFDFLKNTVAV